MCAPAVLLTGPWCWEPLQDHVLLLAETGLMGPSPLLVAEQGQRPALPQ